MATNPDGRRLKAVKSRSTAGPDSPDDGYLRRRRQPTDIAEVTDLILNKGLVLDTFVQGEIWTVDSLITINTLDLDMRPRPPVEAD